jgi:hypothetical protein
MKIFACALFLLSPLAMASAPFALESLGESGPFVCTGLDADGNVVTVSYNDPRSTSLVATVNGREVSRGPVGA